MLETKDLILDKAKMEDFDDIYNNYWKYEETAKYMLWSPCKNLQEAKERLKQIIEYQKTNLSFFVYEKATKKAIGMAGMTEIMPNVYEDSGIGIGVSYVGKGYGRQILNAFLDYLFKTKNAQKIICSCDRNNIPSAKMQQSCGLKYNHTEILTRKKNNQTYVCDYYEITKDDYGMLKANKQNCRQS